MPVTSSAVQAGAGLLQAGLGYLQGHKAQKDLENLQTPTYTPNQAIGDYYNKSLSRYSLNPYESALYKMQAQNINRGTAQGISALKNRGQAIAGVSNLIQGQNDSLLKAGATAEGEQGRNLAQLGAAASAKAGEDRAAFQYNQVAPYEKKYNLLAMKASGGNQTMNAGLQNAFGGVQSGEQAALLKKLYPNGINPTGTTVAGSGIPAGMAI